MKSYNIEPYKDNNPNKDYKREEAYIRAKKKVDKIIGFYWHLAVYIVVNIFLIVVINSNTDDDYNFWSFGTFATAIFWGIGLAFHFLGVFGPNFIFGEDWEARQISKYMDKDKKRWE